MLSIGLWTSQDCPPELRAEGGEGSLILEGIFTQNTYLRDAPNLWVDHPFPTLCASAGQLFSPTYTDPVRASGRVVVTKSTANQDLGV